MAALLGIALGVSFGACFATGLLSHLIQKPPGWFTWPARPAGLYRVTQGVHVATGIAAIPLLLAKLWAVYPKLLAWPPVRDAAHAVERVSLVPLVGGSLFMLVSGTANIARWYPWRFFFPAAHYWVAWITIGALVAHIGAKLATTRQALRRRQEAAGTGLGVTRRRFLGTVAAASGLLTATTAGQTIEALRRWAVLAPRRARLGPQGLPVNTTAAAAGVTEAAADPAYRLVVEGAVARRLEFSLEELRALPQHDATLPIACVEGWSTTARWRGVAVADLLA
ncbi:MAG: molybdopterin-dependent oxidoreductase, partial [Acidimicrobiales bacterium]